MKFAAANFLMLSLLASSAYAANSVTSILPSSGTINGGNAVIIAGTGFTGATAVSVGGAVASFTVDSDTQIEATLAAHVAGAVTVTVTSADAPAPLANGYT